HTFKLMHRRAYTVEARSLARYLIHTGCSQELIGRVIQKIGILAGVSASYIMIRRTVSQALIEGGVATSIQLGYKISQAYGNGDGTTHKNVNYESCIIELKTP
ncbi:uncharacterized protein F5891DRAFT_900556, partial [Suillus fuscotomentosus]